MTARATLIATFLQETQWSDATQTPLAGDASARRYIRLQRPSGQTAIFMDAPKENGEDIRPFLRIAQFLTAHGFSAPEIWHASEEAGLIVMEDLGDDLFVKVMADRTANQLSLYQAAVDVLLELQALAPPANLAVMDNKTLAEMTEPAFTWYCDAPAKGIDEAVANFVGALRRLLETYLPEPSVLVLRDFHAENLLWLPDRADSARVGLLDFQDALIGHPAYDLVSMLQDARRDVPENIERATKAYYQRKTQTDPESFVAGYHLLGLQRNLRILGIFARLCKQAGKPHYVDFIPRVHDHVIRNLAHPALQDIAKLLKSVLPEPTPEFLQSLKDQCATHPKP
ncbi:aminoglycoside phosphotransferase family protein [Shimia sp.]|uniref:aminoglycoside phosphotransferase family protein n=1 Tax=Shimia sp. TaxID=1954381 RepID=UPI003BAAB0CB